MIILFDLDLNDECGHRSGANSSEGAEGEQLAQADTAAATVASVSAPVAAAGREPLVTHTPERSLVTKTYSRQGDPK